MRRLAPTLTLMVVLVACAPTTTPPPTPTAKSQAPRAATPAPSPSAAAASPGPSVVVTNTPTVRVSAGLTPPSPTPAPTFGPIVAGLRDGGVGRAATEVPWNMITDLEVDATGRILVANHAELRRFAVGGTVERVAGGHLRPLESLAGKAATAAGFRRSPPLTFMLDPDQRPVLADGNRLFRLAADGTLAELWQGASTEEVWSVVPRSNGAVSLVVANLPSAGAPRTFAWWTAKPGQAAQLTRACTAAETAVLAEAHADGGLLYGGKGLRGAGVSDELLVRSGENAAWRLSPAGGTPVRLTFGADEPTHLDGRGRFYAIAPSSGRVTRLTPGGGADPLAAKLPENFVVSALGSAPDGTVYAAGSDRSDDGAASRILALGGTAPVEVGGAGALPLGPLASLVLQPRGLVAAGPSTLLVADGLRGQILRLQPGQPPEAAYGKRDGAAPTDGAKAAAVAFRPTALGQDAEGRLYVLHDGAEVYRIEAKGAIKRLFGLTAPTAGNRLTDLAVAPDGTIYLYQPGAPTGQRVFRVDGLDARTPVPTEDDALIGMTAAGDGALHLVLAAQGGADEARVRLARWTAADGLTEVDARVRRVSAYGTRSLALDARGRWWFTLGRAGSPYAILVRFDPATGQTVEVAGRDTDVFGGDTTDDGMIEAQAPVFDPAGDLFWLEAGQVRTLPGAAR